MEERKPSQPIPMPPPTTEPRSTPSGGVEDRLAEIVSSFERQERLQKELDAQLKKQSSEQSGQVESATLPEQPPAPQVQERVREDPTSATQEDNIADNIRRVPDEHLPSHRERQRWDFSKRFSEIMDEVLPKLALVTQKVNTYTGTDYSGVEALRREIKEQGTSVVLYEFALANSVQRIS
jgi:sensitive to high expression protein 9